MKQRNYDSTVARVAGNLLSGVPSEWAEQAPNVRVRAVKMAVAMARLIVEETRRTEPETQEPT